MWMRSLVRIAAVIVAVIGIQQLCVAPYRGNLAIGAVEWRTSHDEADNLPRAVALAHRNLSDLGAAERSRRLDPNWYLLYGANCELLGRWSEAADVYTRALRIDDRPEIYVSRGMARLHLGRIPEAEGDLATAARFNPQVLNDLDGELREHVAAAAGLR
jgi:tetratricopeptide (TPR) repeat protein